MSKINWDVYSRRRRIDLNKLIEKQGIESYSDYLMFCLTINVNPMPEKDFPLSNTKKVEPVQKNAPTKVISEKPKETVKKETKAPAKTKEKSEDRWGIKKNKAPAKKPAKKTGK